MKYYREGVPAGRYIGSGYGISVHSDAFFEDPEEGTEQSDRKRGPDGELWFDYGPSTGGLMESVGMRFLTPGETIRKVSVDPGFKQREIQVTGRDVGDSLLLIERINGFHSASHSIAFCSAVEDALGLEVSEEVMGSRIEMLELERMRSNLEVVKRICEPAGFGVPANQVGYLRERITRVISEASGHRYFFGANSVCSNILDIKSKMGELEAITKEFNGIYASLLQSKIFLNRLQGNGITGSENLIGPAARARGIPADAREDSPSLDYGITGFTPITEEDGDSFGRFMIRSREIDQSLRIIMDLDGRKAKSVLSADTSGSGKGAARIESPQGDLFYYVELEDGLISDIKMISPSIANIRAFEQSMRGNIFTDFHFNWESFGIWIAEAGVVLK